MLLDEDDSILVEAPTYPGALAFLKPLGCDLVPVETDGEGIIPASLRKLLDDWDASLLDNMAGGKGRKPKCLYTCPTGCNPTGATISEERRREIYAIARDHDFLILEDDPYHFLQYQDPSDPAQQARVAAGNPFRVPSFLQIENRWLQEENGNGAGGRGGGGEKERGRGGAVPATRRECCGSTRCPRFCRPGCASGLPRGRRR
jgi:aspartate/methionine/tyrosine aminotransferase